MVKKIIYCALFCLLAGFLQAQEQPRHGFRWGLSLGIETQSLGIEPTDRVAPEETWVGSDRNKPGATLGIVGQKSIWRGLAFQSGLSLSYTSNLVNFYPNTTQTYHFTDLELPAYFTITNQKSSKAPLSAKILFGPRLGWNLARNAGDKLQFLRERLSIDLGLGVEIKLGKWNLSPEMIYSHGLNNLHDFVGADYDFQVGRAVRDKLAFRAVFTQAK